MDGLEKSTLPYIIAVDFDGTLCENKFPEIGQPLDLIINYIKKKQKEKCRIILWTCRVNNRLREAINWCAEQELYFDEVNKNIPELVELFGTESRKIFANEYIDDRNCPKFFFDNKF